MITRCPKCATAFRISAENLKSAKGKVRCGSCLDVFDANHHIQTEEPDTKNSPVPEGKSPNTPVDPAEPRKPSATAWPASAERRVRVGSKHGRAFSDDADESWALELLKDDSDPGIQLKKIVPVKKDENTKDGGPPKNPQTKRQSHLDKFNAKLAAHHKTAQPADRSAKHGPSSGGSGSIQKMLAAIEPDSLEVDFIDEETQRKQLIIWSSLSIAAAIFLFVQVAWLQFHRLNTIEPYRAMYGVVCPVFGCTLPVQRSLRDIETSNLIVRSHPNKENALVVDVILQNNADFEQTFPGILLTFSDLAAKPVAARRFSSKDYLGGELAGISNMPVKQPIHIAIEIQDPGVSALSYNIAVVD